MRQDRRLGSIGACYTKSVRAILPKIKIDASEPVLVCAQREERCHPMELTDAFWNFAAHLPEYGFQRWLKLHRQCLECVSVSVCVRVGMRVLLEIAT